MNEFAMTNWVDFTIISPFRPQSNWNPFGNVKVDHYDKHGNLIGKYQMHNDITNQGKNTIYGVMFYSQAQILTNSWFIGLINATNFTGTSATDVTTSHGGWAEWTNYTQSTRVPWAPGAPANQSISNPSAAVFNMTQPGSLQGVFIVSNGTKGGAFNTDILWATALFSAVVTVNNGDQINISYTCSS